MPTILGVNFGREFFFGGGAETLEKQGRTICGKKLQSKLAEKFAGNFPKFRQAKIVNSPQICSAEPRAQLFSSNYTYHTKSFY